MTSLLAHLREVDQHGGLAFHPGCPICREERLIGTISSEGLISRRVQALIAAGLLAATGAVPATSIAAAPDQEQDGTTTPQPSGGDTTTSPNFDPGGDSTDLPYDASPAPQVQAPPDPGNPDTAPLDQEPSADTGSPVADPGDGSQGSADGLPGAAPSQPPATTPGQPPASTQPGDATSPSVPTPAPAAPIAPTQTTTPQAVAGKPQAAEHAHRPAAGHAEHGAEDGASVEAPAVAPVQPASVRVVASPAASPAAVPSGHRARPGDSAHVVLPGESLWSIAADFLGGTTSPAGIAREVHRVWVLNSKNIGTGDPDLLMVGTKLELR